MKYTVLIFFVSLNFLVSSQTGNFFNDSFTGRGVYFFSPTYPNTEGWIRLLNDDGSNVSNRKHFTTAWELFKTRPVAYVSGQTPMIGADISFICNSNVDYSTWFIRGKNSLGNDLPYQLITLDGNRIRYLKRFASTAFPTNTVLYFEDFEIEWQIAPPDPFFPSIPQDDKWTTIFTSSNKLYVTHKDPNPLNSICHQYTDRYHHSLIHIGCSRGHAINTPFQFITNLWNYFSLRTVQDAQGNDLYYYKEYFCNNTCTPQLLSTKDGQCGAWATFIIDILKAQGMMPEPYSRNYTQVEASGDDIAFLVKDWDFTDNGNIPDTDKAKGYKYVLIPEQDFSGTGIPKLDPFFQNGRYNFLYGDDAVDNTMTIPGQNKSNPASIFYNHQFSFIASKHYDPSYGIIHNESEFIENTLSARAYFGMDTLKESDFNGGMDLNGDNDIDDEVYLHVIYISDDLADFNLEWVEIKY